MVLRLDIASMGKDLEGKLWGGKSTIYSESDIILYMENVARNLIWLLIVHYI